MITHWTMMTDSSIILLFTGKMLVPINILVSDECLMRKRKGWFFCRQRVAGEYLFRMIQVQLLDCGIHYQSNQECRSAEYETRPSELPFV